jgi:glutathione S-transferase
MGVVMILHGTPLSPFVRTVQLALRYKGLHYNLQPLSPSISSEITSQRHPIGKVPILVDHHHEITGGRVITHYLDDAYPVPPLYPGNAIERAHIRWLEEYAYSRLASLLGGVLFYQRVYQHGIQQKPLDQDAIEQCIQNTLPKALDHLEADLPLQGYVTEHLSMAELSLWSVYRCGWMSGLRLNHRPKWKNYLTQIEQMPLIRTLIDEENRELSEFYAPPFDIQP